MRRKLKTTTVLVYDDLFNRKVETKQVSTYVAMDVDGTEWMPRRRIPYSISSGIHISISPIFRSIVHLYVLSFHLLSVQPSLL